MSLKKIFKIVCGFIFFFYQIMYSQNNSTSNSSICLNTGSIIDSMFFFNIDSLLNKNTLFQKYENKIIVLRFGTRNEKEGTVITSMEKKESLFKEFFISVIPVNSFDLFVDNPIVVSYNNKYYLVDSVADSIIVKGGNLKKYFIDIDKSIEYLNNNFEELVRPQIIKCNNGLFEEVLKGSDDFKDYFE